MSSAVNAERRSERIYIDPRGSAGRISTNDVP
jgi:hypothetical protein